MAKINPDVDFIPLNIAVMVVSDSRVESDDKSGKILEKLLTDDGHNLAEKKIVIDDIYEIRAAVSNWIADPDVHAVITTGGTGLTGRDVTPEAMKVLYDKEIEGFGEVFRMISYDLIKTSTIQSRAIAGLANGTVLFTLPGSPGACKDGWQEIIKHQLDVRVMPCNLVQMMPRFKEK
ncbi:molybdenum cofactor biosynthesis protein B [uncultured Cocleimonas sp.]|uniref:molybdenum cofactor biosynthesis protein B n=1 Tax=uncultured Cocleimonas sp. TaxID=1051587 RepID=UPI0026387D92|nr:molybdenum cofactor biosynthesis protein B [uncultured Cocleimonas sp.]